MSTEMQIHQNFEQLQKELEKYFPAFSLKLKNNPDLVKAVQFGLESIENGSLTRAKLNQIMHLCSEAGMSQGFFQYFFLNNPESHPYSTNKVSESISYSHPESVNEIKSISQFFWGIKRFMIDAMLYWGNFRQAYRELRILTLAEIEILFKGKSFNEEYLIKRGKIQEPENIPQDKRYLISEMASKTYESNENISEIPHVQFAIEAFKKLKNSGQPTTNSAIKVEAENFAKNNNQPTLFELLYEDFEGTIEHEEEIINLYAQQSKDGDRYRKIALDNTRTYLSISNDLDVYVATSMRSRDDFRQMARSCDLIFGNKKLKKYNIRYFDPTLSSANFHEDKGIIECLMVKTCKVLIYFAQHKESLGKVSEYAMALSLGKPVIILCPNDSKGTEIYNFYLERHPLTRLVEFSSGIVHGAIITQNIEDVITILERIFSNRMEYDISTKKDSPSYYLLKEKLTGSTVRVITGDKLLTETFWNNYHKIE